MKKLEEFYENREMMAKYFSEEELKRKEKELLQDELTAAVSQSVANVLAGVQSPVCITIDYEPQGTTAVNIVCRDGQETLQENYAPPADFADEPPVEEYATSNYHSRSESKGFVVRFPDGTEVHRKNAKETMIATLKVIGMHKVAAFRGRLFKGYSLVGRNYRSNVEFKCQELVDGWYVYTNMTNDTKINILRQISDELGLGLQIMDETGTAVADAADMTKKGKPSRRTLYKLNGDGPYNKRELVLLAVTQYMMEHPDFTYAQMEQAFPKNLQGSYGVIQPLDWIAEKAKAGADHWNRYYVEDRDVITAADGVRFAVCNQWGDNFANFVQRAEKLGWNVTEV